MSDKKGDTLLPLAKKMRANAPAVNDYQWTSERRLLGLPLVDIQFWNKESIEKHQGVPKPAVGWIACGNRAYGRFVSVGDVAVAPIAFGKYAFGAIAFGLISVGILSMGTIAIGGLAAGAIAMGYVLSLIHI